MSTKVCSRCERRLATEEFPRSRSRADGRGSACQRCVSEAAKARNARKRAEMGEDAWLEHQRQIMARHRSDPANRARGRAATAARSRALWQLAARHPGEFAHLIEVELALGQPDEAAS